MKQDINQLLKEYQDGKLSLNDELILSERLSDPNDVDALQVLDQSFKQSMDTEEEGRKNLTSLLDRIHHTIRLKESGKERKGVLHILRYASRIAAILFLPLLLITSYLLLNKDEHETQSTQLELIAPAGSRLNFELPDGTTGTLAGSSKLLYNSAFVNQRNLKLVGQAYFDVAHDKKHPLQVEANGNTVEVVGTKFSLSAYPEDQYTDLILEEGKVNYISALKNEKVVLEPGMRILDIDGKIEQTIVASWKYTAWKDGKLVFRNEPMEELGKRIARWYNVEVLIKSPALNENRFRGVFEDDSLEEVLALLKMTSPIKYKIQEREVKPDGSFTKKKVIFY